MATQKRYFYVFILLLSFSAISLSQSYAAISLSLQITDPGTTNFSTTPSTNPPIGFVTLYMDIHRPTLTTPLQMAVNNPGGYSHTFPSLPTAIDGLVEQSNAGDIVTITLKSIPSSKVYRYEILLHLQSNYNGATLENTMGGNENWSIGIGSGGLDIQAACPISVYWNAPGADPAIGVLLPGSPSPPAPSGTQPATISVPAGTPWVDACANIRPGIDVVMVLDKSGSMGWSTGSTRPRIEVLRDAVEDFIEAWKDIRENEAGFTPSIVNTDNIGIVFFNQDAPASWSGLPANLNNFSTTNCNIATSVESDCVTGGGSGNPEPDPIDAVAPGGSTSIGDGLFLADSILESSTSERKVVLLMSDGMQNTDKIVGIDASTGRVYTHPPGDTTNPGGTRDLSNQDEYQIYSVTIGPSTVVSPIINQNIAIATGGFYINAEEQFEFLRPFFLELLQNFLRFNTLETVRMVSASVTPQQHYETDIPVTGTSTSFIVNVLANRRHGWLRLTLQPPGGGYPIVREGSGALRISQSLAGSNASGNAPGIWRARVDLVDPGHIRARVDLVDPGHINEVPIHLFVLSDDVALKSELNFVAGNYVPGDQIRLQARLTEFGAPIVGLNSQPDAKVLAKLVKPGETIGDLLSNSAANTNDPVAGENHTAAEAKLMNALEENPELLVRNTDTITLLDNGQSSNGDAIAGDGVYGALYPVELPGHYNFLFAVEGKSAKVGKFSRQQMKTAYVKSLPDPEETSDTIQTSIQQTADDRKMVINLTPVTKFGHRLGPGWSNYFWFTAPGQSPFKAQDNIDGTYTATLIFSGDTPPKVSLHFLDVAVIIDDSVTAEKLPVPLDGNNMFLPDVKPQEEPCSCFDLWCHIKRFFN